MPGRAVLEVVPMHQAEGMYDSAAEDFEAPDILTLVSHPVHLGVYCELTLKDLPFAGWCMTESCMSI